MNITTNDSTTLTRLVNGEISKPVYDSDTVAYNYNVAMDSLSLLLYWVHKDVKTFYDTVNHVSSANSDNAYALFKSQNYTVTGTSQDLFTVDKAIDYLNKDNLIYMRGFDAIKNAGHAWVMDGYYYCVDSLNQPKERYLHCDYGWNGAGNGYYHEMFIGMVGSYCFDSPLRCFAIKREYTTSPLDLEWNGPVH